MLLRHALFYSKRWSRPVTHVYGYSAFERTEMPKSFCLRGGRLPYARDLMRVCIVYLQDVEVYYFVSNNALVH